MHGSNIVNNVINAMQFKYLLFPKANMYIVFCLFFVVVVFK